MNIDPKTGIHYGVISQHSIASEAFSDIMDRADDLSYKGAVEEVKKSLKFALSDYFSDTKWSDQKQSKLERAVENAWGAIEDDFNDGYQGEMLEWEYKDDEYELRDCLDFDVFVIKSPYFTYAQPCSPCVPNAGNLDHVQENGLKTYCLGHDFFEDNKAPYPVYLVETGELVAE